MVRRSIRIVCALAAVIGLGACGGTPEGGTVDPIELDVPSSEYPSPGLCKIVGVGLTRSCDGIERGAPGGARILYRPRDGTRRIVVCYLHVATVGEIIGVDVFDMDNRRLIETIQKRGDPAPPDGCKSALD